MGKKYFTNVKFSATTHYMENETQNLIRLGRLHAKHKGLSLRTIATVAAKGGAFFDRLESGKSITVKKYYTVLSWFSNNWPEGLDWPSDIPRPAPEKDAA